MSVKLDLTKTERELYTHIGAMREIVAFSKTFINRLDEPTLKWLTKRMLVLNDEADALEKQYKEVRDA